MRKRLTLSSMIKEYKNAKADMQLVFDTFFTLYEWGYVSSNLWDKFCRKCWSWRYDLDRNVVEDINGFVIHDFACECKDAVNN